MVGVRHLSPRGPTKETVGQLVMRRYVAGRLGGLTSLLLTAGQFVDLGSGAQRGVRTEGWMDSWRGRADTRQTKHSVAWSNPRTSTHSSHQLCEKHTLVKVQIQCEDMH